MNQGLAVLAGAILIAASVLFIGRYEISGITTDTSEAVFRLDRWTGEIRRCTLAFGDPKVVADYKLNRKVVIPCDVWLPNQ